MDAEQLDKFDERPNEGCFLLLFDGEVWFTFRVHLQREFLLGDKGTPYLC